MLSSCYIYKTPIHKHHDTNSRHHRTRHTHPRQDTKVPSTENTTPTTTKHPNDKPKTTMKMNNQPRSGETDMDGAGTPRRCLHEGYDRRKPSSSDPEDQVFTRSDAEVGAPRRSLQGGEQCPQTPPPSASTGTGQVVNPGAPTSP